MPSVNKAIIVGNVCADPKITTFPEGGKVAQFSVATNERAYKTKDGREIPEQTEFHNIVINRNSLVEIAEKYVHKGDPLYIEGKIKTRTYEDKQSITRYVTEIYAYEIQMLAKKDKANGAPAPAPFGVTQSDAFPSTSKESEMPF